MSDNILPTGFAEGVVEYRDYDPSQNHSRIMIPVRFGDYPNIIFAVMDTGAPWCILAPNLASRARIDYYSEEVIDYVLVIRGSTMRGLVHTNVPIHIDALKGQGVTVPSTVFIPELAPGQVWDLPNFLGLSGFLERIRFAVDPGNNLFYFGALED
jgi:hypothetical protein